LEKLPLGEALNALGRLAEPPPADAGPPALRDLAAGRRRLLMVLPAIFRAHAGTAEVDELSLHSLIAAHYAVEAAALGPAGEAPGEEVAEAKEDLTRRLASLATARIKRQPEEVDRTLLPAVLSVALDWRAIAEPMKSIVSKHTSAAGTSEAPGTFLEALRAASRHGRDARSIAEALARWELQGLHVAEGQVAAEILIVMVEGNILVSEATSRLRTSLLHRLPLPDLVRLAAACAEQDLGADVLKPVLQARVAVAGPGLAAVPPANLLRLAMSAAKSPVIVEHALGPIAGAAAATLSIWPMDSVAELLLVVATKELGSPSSGARKLFSAAAEVMRPRLGELSLASLLKTVVASGTALPHCRKLLETAADVATSQLNEFLPEQVLLLTQGTLGLGARHAAVHRLLDFWARALGGEISSPCSTLLSADEVADLARLLALVAPGHMPIFEAIATRLNEAALAELSPTGRATLEAAFPESGGPDFPSRTRLMSALAAYQGASRLAERSRSRSCRRSRSRGSCASPRRSPEHFKRRREVSSPPRDPSPGPIDAPGPVAADADEAETAPPAAETMGLSPPPDDEEEDADAEAARLWRFFNTGAVRAKLES